MLVELLQVLHWDDHESVEHYSWLPNDNKDDYTYGEVINSWALTNSVEWQSIQGMFGHLTNQRNIGNHKQIQLRRNL